MAEKLEIIQYTDPMCIWCLALEPVMRKIDYLLRDNVKFTYHMGLLVDDIREIIGDDAHSAERFKQLQAKMHSHFLDASKRSGIPVEPAFLGDTEPSDVTSLPMSLAYEAVKRQNIKIADKFLRRMREGAHNENKLMARMENLTALVREFNLDEDRFINDMQNGNALNDLKADMELSRGKGVQSFPTVELKYGSNTDFISGYHDFDFFKEHILRLTNGEIDLKTPHYTLQAAENFVNYYGRVMERELQVMFNLTDLGAFGSMEELCSTGKFEKEKRGNGYYIKALY